MPYLAHFGLEDHPFTLTPDVEYFFPTPEHANIMASVEFALRRDTGIIKVVGEVGTGKTLLCRLLMRRLVDTDAVAYINAPRANAQSIILAVCEEFGITVDPAASPYTALNRFLVAEHEKGRLAVVVIDEAQHLGKDGLEAVRLISNLETEKSKLLQIVLFGQTELDDLLRDPSLRQLNQRVVFSLTTKPMTPTESTSYIKHRVGVSRRAGIEYDIFAPRAAELIARHSRGIPRVINILADKSLLAAFAAGSPTILPAHVAEAIRDSAGLAIPSAAPPRPWLHVATRIGIAVAAAATLAAAVWGVTMAVPAWREHLRPKQVAVRIAEPSPPPIAVPARADGPQPGTQTADATRREAPAGPGVDPAIEKTAALPAPPSYLPEADLEAPVADMAITVTPLASPAPVAASRSAGEQASVPVPPPLPPLAETSHPALSAQAPAGGGTLFLGRARAVPQSARSAPPRNTKPNGVQSAVPHVKEAGTNARAERQPADAALARKAVSAPHATVEGMLPASLVPSPRFAVSVAPAPERTFEAAAQAAAPLDIAQRIGSGVASHGNSN